MKGRGLKRFFHLDRFGGRLEESLDEEVHFHLQARIDGFVRGGMTESEAREAALEQFGDPELVTHRCRRIDRTGVRRRAAQDFFGDLGQDMRVAHRSLAKARGFSLVAILSLACGIGVFTSVFSLTHATILRPVPGVEGADRAVELLLMRDGTNYGAWDYPDFRDLRENQSPLQDLAAFKDRTGTLSTPEGGEQVELTHVSASYFRVLGVTPTLGRGFLDSEDLAPGQHPVAVVSHRMWQEGFQGDPEIVGRRVTLNQLPYTVVGVAPEMFRSHLALQTGRDFWLPLMQDPWVAGEDRWVDDRDAMWMGVLGRLADGATVEEANAALETIFTRLGDEHPELDGRRSARAYPFGPVPALARTMSRITAALTFGLMAMVLLIICGNVAGMVLARSVSREREIAIRLALGSARARLVRLLLVESLLLATAGGGLGLLLGVWGLDVVRGMVPGFPEITLGVSGPVLVLTLLLALGTTLAVGLLPAARFSRPELVSSLKDDSGGGGRKVSRIHRVSASAQAGLALSLLVTCGLFLRGLGVMQDKDLGFEPRGLYTASIDVSQVGSETLDLAEPLLVRFREALASIPGVTAVSMANGIPLDLSGNFTGVSRGDQPDPAFGRVQVEFTTVDEGFFEAIGAPITRGRGFEITDDEASDPVMVITESLAATLWPGEEVLGRSVWSGMAREGPQRFTIVGVVADLASSRPTENWPNIFVPYRQNFRPRFLVAIRGEGDSGVLQRSIQSALLAAEPNLSFPSVVSSEALVERGTGSQRLWAGIAGVLGFLALLLSAVGVYGVVAFGVSGRTREIGLRMAMGATRRQVLTGVLRDGVGLAVPGLAIGTLVAMVLGFSFRAEFLGLNPVDPWAFAGAVGVLLLVVLLAGWVPARRAAGVEPMKALRTE